MTVIMHDAVALLGPSTSQAFCNSQLFDVLYADDTLLLGAAAADVEALAAAVERVGSTFGMTLHWGKTQAMSVFTASQLRQPDGTFFRGASSLKYLGATIYGDGCADSEISQKLGIARADFQQLSKVWRHANVTIESKLYFFHSLIISRLMSGLSGAWLVTAQRRRLDGFYARCLRQILRIPPSFLSRVSNVRVFRRAGATTLSQQLLQCQLIFLGKVARAGPENPVRRDTFIPNTILPQLGSFVGRRGRPRQDWTRQLIKEGVARLGLLKFDSMLSDTSPGAQARWKQEMQEAVPNRCTAE